MSTRTASKRDSRTRISIGRFTLFKKRQLWLPTWPACLVGLVVLVLLALWIFSGLHRFLAVTEPAEGADVLVVESWISDPHVKQLAIQLKAEDPQYREVWLTGPKLSRGSVLLTKDRDSYAALTAESLLALGVSREMIHVVPAADTLRHRTWNAATKLRDEFESTAGQAPDRFDLYTVGNHARRSRLVFQKVCGEGVEVGVIALEPVDYDAATWYKSSAGLKGTALELIAWLHEKIADSGR